MRVSSTGKPQFVLGLQKRLIHWKISFVRENDGQGTVKRSYVEVGIRKDITELNENSEKVEEEKENVNGKEYQRKHIAANEAQ